MDELDWRDGQRQGPGELWRRARRLRTLQSPEEEARLKAAGIYGGLDYKPPAVGAATGPSALNQHFGPGQKGLPRPQINVIRSKVLEYFA